MHDPADDPAIVYPLDTAHIARQIRPNSSPLLVAQPKQILAHDPDPLPKTNQDRILSAQKLMSFDPNSIVIVAFAAHLQHPTIVFIRLHCFNCVADQINEDLM
jgi:hypothetical protein